MKKKGQQGISEILLVAIAVIVGMVLLVASAPFIGEVTNIVTVTNQTITAPAGNASVDLQGKFVTITDVRNSTYAFDSSNYTVNNTRLVDGSFAPSQIVATSGSDMGQSGLTNVSYTYQPFGYATSSGARSIVSLILIFFALAIAVVAISPTLRSKVFR